ncbi:MAG TPA: hypothetical protein VHG28_19770 [Longimicrobiaceae bacterium]|nr:hypothetical protein [Longimicrobiaceae bacterium]
MDPSQDLLSAGNSYPFSWTAQGTALRESFLYLSLYLRQNWADYYDALQRVRTHGDRERWLLFYLIGVEAVARQAADTTRALLELFEADAERVRALGRSAGSTLRIFELLRRRILLTIPRAAEMMGLSQSTVTAALRRMMELGIVLEITGRERARQFVYPRQMEILNEGIQG